MESETDNRASGRKRELYEPNHHPQGETLPRWRPSGSIDREHPIGGEMSDVVHGLFRHVRLPWLMQYYAQTPVLAIFSFINRCISIGLIAILVVCHDTWRVFVR